MEAVIGPVGTATTSMLVDIHEQTQIGAARRAAVALGHLHNLSLEQVGRLAIVVTEAAANIVRHAGSGVVVLRALVSGNVPTVELLALDKGPGIPSVARAMEDGYSTAGTPGKGLGAIRRLSDLFEVHSQRGMGTAIFARVGAATIASPAAATRRHARLAGSRHEHLGVVSVPLRGETECGDAWQVRFGRQSVAVLVVDGLGHGSEAAAAAAIAVSEFAKGHGEPSASVLANCDTAMRGSRGAAVSVASIDHAGCAVRFSGVGNVDGRVLTTGQKTEYLIPQNGIVGHTMPTVKSMTTSWSSGSHLVMHSDGISARWRIDAYEGLMTAHPALIAGVIFRDFARGNDDATVLVLGGHAPVEER